MIRAVYTMGGRVPTLIFVHIPKAAGTTLHKIIDRQYASRLVHRCDVQVPGAFGKFLALGEARRARLRCLKGHLPFGLHEHLPGAFTYITVLRHPVQRFLSKYHYLLKMPALAERLGIPGDALASIARFADLQEERAASNFQTRLLAGCLDPRRPHAPYDPLPADAVERAEANLRVHFSSVGLVENFDESLLIMKQVLGWGHVCYARRNVNARRPAADRAGAEVLSRIERLNALDMRLYDVAAALFDRQVRAYRGDLQKDLAAFRKDNGVFDGVQRLVRRVVRRPSAAHARGAPAAP
jgi:hypothetical protein